MAVQFKVVPAMEGTSDYGWRVLLSNDGENFGNFYGNRPLNEAMVEKIRTRNLANGWEEVS